MPVGNWKLKTTCLAVYYYELLRSCENVRLIVYCWLLLVTMLCLLRMVHVTKQKRWHKTFISSIPAQKKLTLLICFVLAFLKLCVLDTVYPLAKCTLHKLNRCRPATLSGNTRPRFLRLLLFRDFSLRRRQRQRRRVWLIVPVVCDVSLRHSDLCRPPSARSFSLHFWPTCLPHALEQPLSTRQAAHILAFRDR